MNFQIFEHLHT